MSEAAAESVSVLKAPFPAFGGKARVSVEVWDRFGDVDNFVESFVFSGAITLKRPANHRRRIETINDRNAYVANFWRAVQRDPDAVAHHADWPVNETDLHARHRWLVASDRACAQLRKVREDPDAFDVKIAGWWCWGACCWIGSGWCDETHRNSSNEPRQNFGPDGLGNGINRAPSEQVPDLSGDAGASGRGVHAGAGHKRVKLSGNGVGNGVHSEGPNARRPGLGQVGWGVTVGADDTHRPQLADQFARGRGVNGNDRAGTCEQRRAWIRGWMQALCDRLRPVRVCCGHWSRVCDSPSTMTRLGLTGVFLDPPYGEGLVARAVVALRGAGWLAPGTLIVAETARDEAPALAAPPLAERVHGKGRVAVWREGAEAG